MKRFVLIMLILMSGAALWAQVPPTSAPAASEPAPAPAAPSTLATTTVAADVPPTLPTTLASASTQTAVPRTQWAVTEPSTQFAATLPTTHPTTLSSTAPTNRPVTPYYSDYSSRRSSDRSFSRRENFTPLPPSSGMAGVVLTPRPISREYYGLMQRSIFIKGRQNIYDSPDRPRYVRPTTDMASTLPSGPPPSPFDPENMLVFNGASDNSGQMLAFIENTGLNTIGQYHVGDAIAQGKVAAITLDSMDYQAGSRVRHIMLGQNLNGVDTATITTQPVMAAAPGGAPTTAPASGLTNGPAPDTNVDSVLERLRRRRMQELGGQ